MKRRGPESRGLPGGALPQVWRSRSEALWRGAAQESDNARKLRASGVPDLRVSEPPL